MSTFIQGIQIKLMDDETVVYVDAKFTTETVSSGENSNNNPLPGDGSISVELEACYISLDGSCSYETVFTHILNLFADPYIQHIKHKCLEWYEANEVIHD